MKKIGLILIVPLLFFIFSVITLSQYGISWDEPIHFTRGQAYLNFFLSGDSAYKSLNFNSRHSYYTDPSQPAQFFFKKDSGHPPINGIMAAFSNYIIYEKLGVLGDIESYHFFNVLISTLLVVVVVFFANQSYGKFAAIVAGITLATYPLFFAEAHFNIKDPAEAAFFAGCVWAFWKATRHTSWKWLLLSAVFFGLGLGTKFNILFLPFIIFPWLIIRYWYILKDPFKYINKLPKKIIAAMIIFPIIAGAIFFFSWPYLWQNPIENTLSIFRYYKEIGTGGRGQLQYILPGGFNLFPTFWIITTTPPWVLILSIFGVIAAFFKIKEKEKTSILWLIWLFVPIFRVTVPGSSLYGGIRQIMEFLPAMALLSGLGACFLVDLISKGTTKLSKLNLRWVAQASILLIFIPHLIVMKNLHPNENVYFNSIIGGLAGAKVRDVPYYGNSFGNAYYQAVAWINHNALPGSKIALVQGTKVNIPEIYFSSSIHYSNSFWSGINRSGEYLVELTHQGNEMAYPAVWEHINKVLIPVYEVKVDGVAIAKVWKNDLAHSQPQYQKEESLNIESVETVNDFLLIKLDKIYSLARIIINFDFKGQCVPFNSGIILTSLDNLLWRTEPEKISDQQIVEYSSLEDGKIHYLLPARQAKYIKIKTGSINSCLFQNTKVQIYGFK